MVRIKKGLFDMINFVYFLGDMKPIRMASRLTKDLILFRGPWIN